MLHLNKRKIQDDASGLSFYSPEPWLGLPGVARQYSGMVFDRTGKDSQKILGVGHRLVDQAIKQARGLTGAVTAVPVAVIAFPIYLFRITDRVTSQGGVVRAVTVAVERGSDGFVLVRDWEAIGRLNRVLAERDPRRFRVQAAADPTAVQADVDSARTWLTTQLQELDLPFRVPDINICCLLLPGDRMAPYTEDNVGDDDT